MTQEEFITLMRKPVDKIHKADFKQTKEGWVLCTKPSGETYGLIINSLVEDISAGKKEYVNYDEKKKILEFRYAKGEANPFK